VTCMRVTAGTRGGTSVRDREATATPLRSHTSEAPGPGGNEEGPREA